MSDKINIPSVSTRIHSWERHTTIVNLQQRLVREVNRTKSSTGHRLRETDDSIMGDDSALLDWGGDDCGGDDEHLEKGREDCHFAVEGSKIK